MKLRGNLQPGEYAVLATRAHESKLIPAAILLFLSAAVASFASTVYPSFGFLGVLAYLLALWLLILCMRRTLSWAQTGYILTNHRLVIQKGILRLRQYSLPLEVIHAVNVQPTRFRWGKSAQLQVHTPGSLDILSMVPEGEQFSMRIYGQQQQKLGYR